ncbi:MAG: class I SAM-dependent methyltransferase [candidate division WOR-3 bacterium]
MKRDWELTPRLRFNLQRLWEEFEQLKIPAEFVNLEGGGIEQHYDRRLRFHHCANYAAAMTILGGENRPLRLLELGCGSGALAFGFARTMPAEWTLLATDYSWHLIDFARRNYQTPNLKFECFDIAHLNRRLLSEFDAVMMLEVIEHLNRKQVQMLFSRLHRGLKPNARVIISTLDRSAFRRPFSGYCHHKTEYSYQTLSQLLSQPEVNPFTEVRILRLLSRDIVAAAVRAEERGGYFINRIAGMVNRLTAGRGGLKYYQQRLLGGIVRIYRGLSLFKTSDGSYPEDIYLVEDGAAVHNQESFSLIAVLTQR